LAFLDNDDMLFSGIQSKKRASDNGFDTGSCPMIDHTEKRASERFYLKAPIKYFYPDKKSAIETNMFNCSEGGLYFETEAPLTPGMNIVVCGAEDAKTFRVSIKWCKRVGPVNKTIYGVGAQYRDDTS